MVDADGKENAAQTGLSRRALVRGAAWVVPTIAVASAAPAFAASTPGENGTGAAQNLVFVLQTQTSAGSTPTRTLFLANDGTNPMVIPANATWAFTILIASRTADGVSSGSLFTGMAVRGEAGSSGTVTLSPMGRPLPDAQLAGDITPDGSVGLSVTSSDTSTNTWWAATVTVTQVTA